MSKLNGQKAKNFGYFFFADGVASQDNAAAAISALLHQLYRSQHELIRRASKRLEGTSHHIFNSYSGVWNPINMNEASTILLKVCVSYLTYFVPDPDEHMPGIWSQSRIETYLEQCRKDPPRAFFPYAALHWVNHYRPLRNTLKSEYDWMLQPDRVDFQIWVKVHRSWIEEYFTVDAAPEAR